MEWNDQPQAANGSEDSADGDCAHAAVDEALADNCGDCESEASAEATGSSSPVVTAGHARTLQLNA